MTYIFVYKIRVEHKISVLTAVFSFKKLYGGYMNKIRASLQTFLRLLSAKCMPSMFIPKNRPRLCGKVRAILCIIANNKHDQEI